MRGSLYDNFKDKLVQPNSGSEAFNSGVKQANSRARKLVKKLFDELETLRKKHTVFISKDEVIYFLRLVEILLIFSVAVTSSISVQGPGLSASPGGFVRISLRCLSLTHFACFGIIIHNMIASAVGMKMFLQSPVCVTDSNFIEA